jgi:[ribosomal protein S18]-alanine N-acetyltransferase
VTAIDLDIRRADIDRDLAGVLAVDRVTFENPWTRDMYEWEARHSDVARLYVARDRAAGGDPLVAYCAVWVIFDELHINNLAVHPDWRRRGVASALLQWVLDAAEREGAVRSTLEVRRSNDAARLLYERFGFTVAGTRPGYYRTPVEDALILWRGAPRAGPAGDHGLA